MVVHCWERSDDAAGTAVGPGVLVEPGGAGCVAAVAAAAVPAGAVLVPIEVAAGVVVPAFAFGAALPFLAGLVELKPVTPAPTPGW